MKKTRNLLAAAAVIAAVASPAGWAAAQGAGEVISVTPAEAKKMIEEVEGLQLVDVRTPQEYAQGALPGSTLVPWNSWYTRDFVKKMGAFDREKPLLLVCAVGGRSWAAAGLLRRNGFREVYNLNGGLQAWAMQRIPLPEKKEKSGAPR